MKKTWKLALGAAMALTLVTGCSATEDSGKQQLVVSTWGLSQDVWEQEVKIPFEEKYDVIQPLGIQIYKNIYNKTYIADVALNDETYRNEPNIVARYESNLDVITITGKYNGNYVQFTTYDPDCPLIEYVKMCANWEID